VGLVSRIRASTESKKTTNGVPPSVLKLRLLVAGCRWLVSEEFQHRVANFGVGMNCKKQREIEKMINPSLIKRE
jgi:hypothetical protein